MSGGEDLGGLSLFELFRAEVEAQAATLEQGLVEVEGRAAAPAAVEPLMRAAHSIKGAARIVGLSAAVGLAHAMEDLLVAAQRGEARLGPAAVDALLGATDLLRRLARAPEGEAAARAAEEEPAAVALLARLAAARGGEAAPAPGTAPAGGPAPAAAPAAAPDPAADAAHAPSGPGAPPREGLRPGVRVDAESLTRVMAYAGESVVTARRLAERAAGLARVKAGVERAARALERAQRAPARAGDPLALARQELARVRRVLTAEVEALDQAEREGTDLAERMYEQVLQSRLRPFSEGVAAFPRLVRDLAREMGKELRLEVAGHEVPVDRDILDALEAPLNHMLRNAVDHGVETPAERRAYGKPSRGWIRLAARHHAGMLEIRVEDDGRGVDLEALRAQIVERRLIAGPIARELSEPELLEFLFLPGFSTARAVSEISGRGVGLDVVHSMVRAAGGTVRAERRPEGGLRFVVVLPITRSVIRVVLVEAGGQPLAFPLAQVERLARVPAAAVVPVEDRDHVELDGRRVGLVPTAALLGLGAAPEPGATVSVVVLRGGDDCYGLVVDRIRGEQRLVVRPLDARLGRVACVNALALDDAGHPVVILDVPDLVRTLEARLHEGRMRPIHARARAAPAARPRKRVLVVDDSLTVREVERKLLAARGYEVETAVDGAVAWDALRARRFDLVLTDVDMPRMDGIELVRRVRADERLARTPVMIVSYKDREEDRMRGLEAGANVYLTKSSFHDETLVREVVQLIGGAEAE